RVVRSGMGIWLARLAEAGEVVWRAPGQYAREQRDVLESAVHALTEEGSDRVRGVTEQQRAPARPGPGLDGRHPPQGCLHELPGEPGDERHRVGEPGFEEPGCVRFRFQVRERRRALERQEQRTGEAAVPVRQ